MITTEESVLLSMYSNRILDLIDEQPDMPRGDLQGCVEAIVLGIYNHGKFTERGTK